MAQGVPSILSEIPFMEQFVSGFLAHEKTPREIVAELDKFIIGQKRAKKVVAIALRNRARRRQLSHQMKEEVSPKNILMIGPTGVGKTEIARRLAKLARAPFVKVEATKYTEVGYVGRDVESMVRDLVEHAIKLVREEKIEYFREAVEELVLNKVLDELDRPPSSVKIHQLKKDGKPEVEYEIPSLSSTETEDTHPAYQWWRRREAMKPGVVKGNFDDREIEITITEKQESPLSVIGGMPGGDPSMGGGMGGGMQGMDQLQSLFDKMSPKQKKTVRMKVSEARKSLFDEEIEKLIDLDSIKIEAIDRAQNDGIIFIDEFDKICAGSGTQGNRDVSREGVQRDILPIIEGSTVFTKHGAISTDHVLFIAAGAFHVSKPSDLIPELQGRLPLRVELESLNAEEFKQILTEPDNAITKQYSALLETEGVSLNWQDDGIDEIAKSAAKVNSGTENIGARRLHTILEKILEDVSFEAPEMGVGEIVINRGFVQQTLKDVLEDQDLSRYIL